MANGWNNEVFNSDGEITANALKANTVGIPGGWVSNLALKYSGSVLSVSGNAAVLSATRPAYVTMQSKTGGLLKTVAITEDQGFLDDTGASEIIGNLFGLPTGVAYASDIPFFIYAVLSDSETDAAIMCSRVPGMSTSPAAAKIGDPSSAIADVQSAFFSFEDITEADYEGNPCIMIGSFRMQMSAADDWTVTALNIGDGIGRFNDLTVFDFLAGTFGAAATTYMYDNGGTAAQFTINNVFYTISPLGDLDIRYFTEGDGGQDGVGAVTCRIATPYIKKNSGAATLLLGSASVRAQSAAAITQYSFVNMTNSAVYWTLAEASDSTMQNADFSAGARFISTTLKYRVSNTE